VDLLYGRNAVLEALRAERRSVRRLFIADSARGVDHHLAEARRRRVPIEAARRPELDRWVGEHHQGVVAETEGFVYSTLDEVTAGVDSPFLLVLDSLQDPQNFGTLLRTAQACGVDGVIIPEHRAVAVTPAVSNASAGAVEHLAVARVNNLSRALRRLQEQGVWVHGLAVDGAQPLPSADLRGALALVVGSEGSGLSRLVRETCDVLLAIPMAAGAVQSLNAAVAGSLVVYQAFVQRQSEGQ
jgi:23S rRNA (guanosine2251-2'-O)-methyltransferase